MTEKERRKREKNRRHHLAQRAKERAKREEKRAKEEAWQQRIDELKAEIGVIEKQREDEAGPSTKKKKVEAQVTPPAEAQQSAAAEAQGGRRDPRPRRGAFRGGARGRGGWRRDHGGFRANVTHGHEEVARQYRDRTPQLGDSSMLSSVSAPASSSMIDTNVIAGLGVLGIISRSLQAPAPMEPVATSSPAASRPSRPSHWQGGNGAPRGNASFGRGRQDPPLQQPGRQQQQHQQPQGQSRQSAASLDRAASSRQDGGRGAAPPRQ